MTDRKSWSDIKAEQAAKREAKGKPPVKSFGEIGSELVAHKESKRAAKLDRIAEKARAKQGIRLGSAAIPSGPVEGGGEVDPSHGEDPPSRIDLFCETCFAPAEMTPRGPRCKLHDHPEVMCEPCGERVAAALHNGLYQCGRCISEGAA